MFKVKFNYILYLFFILSQFFVIELFFNHGHDTYTYMEMAKGIGESYLEISWRIIFSFFNNYIIRIYIMLFLLILPAFFILKNLFLMTNSRFSKFIIFFMILSYEISGVSGALRQEIIVLFFALYLISYNYFYYFLSIIFHWIGILYIFFNKYYKIIFIILFILSTYMVFVFYQDIVNLNFYSRIVFYLSNPFKFNFFLLVSIIVYKFIIFLLFFYNKKLLNYLKINKIKFIRYFFVFSPLLQILIFLITKSPQIFQRLGMVFDPFIIIFMGLIIIFGNKYSKVLVSLLIIIKFAMRLKLLIIG